MASIDSSDVLNTVVTRVLETLQAFAENDVDWEEPLFVRGHPALNPDERLPHPVVAVLVYHSEVTDIGYDNVIETNDLAASDPNYEELHGVAVYIDLYIEIWVSKPTATNPVPTGGGIVANRISGKIQTRLRGHSECLGSEMEVLRVRDLGEVLPITSNDPQIMYRLIDLQLLVGVPLEAAP